jgi:hypothetical protein
LINIDLDNNGTEFSYEDNVKHEDELVLSNSIKTEVDVDVKTECSEIPSVFIFEAPIISYGNKIFLISMNLRVKSHSTFIDSHPIPCISSSLTDTVAVKDEDKIKEEFSRRSSISSEQSSSEESEYSKQLAIQRKCDICGNFYKNLQQHKLKIQ